MTRFGIKALAVTVVIGFSGLSAPAQQFVNGGVESSATGTLPPFNTNPSPSTITSYALGTSLNGFTVIGPANSSVLVVGNSYSEPGINFNTSATGGTYAADLTGLGNSGIGSGISQTVNGLTAGQQYQLAFSVGRATSLTNINYPTTSAGDAVVGLSIDSGALATFTNPAQTNGGVNYQDFTRIFTATASSVTFAFTSQTTTTNFVGLDNVSLTPVPEPAAVLATVSGVLGLLRLRRRAA